MNNQENRQNTEEKLRHQLFLEETLAKISNVFLTPWEPDLNEVLRILGETFKVSRVYIFQYSADGTKMDNTYEWCDSKTEYHGEHLKGMDTGSWAWCLKTINNSETLIIDDVKTLPKEAEREKQFFLNEKIHAVAAVPIKLFSGRIMGFIGFDSSKERQWPKADIRILRVVAYMISMNLERKRKEEELIKGREELFRLNEELKYKVDELEAALNHIKKLEGLIPICMQCKKMRLEGEDPKDPGAWISMERYIDSKTDASFSHGLCPECLKQMRSSIKKDKK